MIFFYIYDKSIVGKALTIREILRCINVKVNETHQQINRPMKTVPDVSKIYLFFFVLYPKWAKCCRVSHLTVKYMHWNA